jgi:hypothetical protein
MTHPIRDHSCSFVDNPPSSCRVPHPLPPVSLFCKTLANIEENANSHGKQREKTTIVSTTDGKHRRKPRSVSTKRPFPRSFVIQM